jgi:hypothetical protein
VLGALQRVCAWILPAENPTAAIYGVIVIGALLAAESPRHESYIDTLASAAIAAALYWLAHSYAGMLGRRLRTGERLTTAALVRALGHDWPLVRGAAVPLLALLLASLAGAGRGAAVSAAVWSSAASIAVFELIAGQRTGAGRRELALEVAVGIAMGVAILALKIVLH